MESRCLCLKCTVPNEAPCYYCEAYILAKILMEAFETRRGGSCICAAHVAHAWYGVRLGLGKMV